MLATSNKYEGMALKREEHQLPPTVEGIVQAVDSIIRGGQLQKLIIEIGRPIIAYRMVEKNEYEDPGKDLDAAIRNGEMTELKDAEDPNLTLVTMLNILQEEHLTPVCFVTGSPRTDLIYKWTGFSRPHRHRTSSYRLLGINLVHMTSLPEETLILCGAEGSEPDVQDITFSIKVTMEVRNAEGQRKRQPDAGGSGHNPKERSAADGGVENNDGGGSS